MKKEEHLFFSVDSIDGIKFQVIASSQGIRSVLINQPALNSKKHLTKLQPDDPYLFDVFNQLREYFDLKRKYFTIPLDVKGTRFQKRVWEVLRQVPYGGIITYTKVAKELGNENLYKAIGKTCKKNPVPILVPCHRIVYSNGKLGSYVAGKKVKEQLLELEGNLSLELFKE